MILALLLSLSAFARNGEFTCSGTANDGSSIVAAIMSTSRGPEMRVVKEETRIIKGYAVKNLQDPRGITYSVPGEAQLVIPNMQLRPGDGHFSALLTIEKPGSETSARLSCSYLQTAIQ